LEAQGLAANVYRTALLGLCANWDKVVSCETTLREKGATFEILKEAGKDENGDAKFVTTFVAQRPEVGMAFKAWDKVRQFGGLFGFSPADVQKVAAKQPEPKSLREELMGTSAS
jgi:phage terminase small subunit